MNALPGRTSRGELRRLRPDRSGYSPGAGSTIISLTDDANLAGYPNPVRRGCTLKLDYTVAHAGHVSIDVVDVAGKTVYSHSENLDAGSNQIPINTDGWPNGAYMIKLSTEGATATQRVMVVDK